jgi:hypothetical protein
MAVIEVGNNTNVFIVAINLSAHNVQNVGYGKHLMLTVMASKH